MKRVTITIEADAEFISALNTNVGLSQDRKRGKTRQMRVIRISNLPWMRSRHSNLNIGLVIRRSCMKPSVYVV